MPLDNDIPRSRLTSLIERERARRLAESDPELNRDILNGARVTEYFDGKNWIVGGPKAELEEVEAVRVPVPMVGEV